MSGLIWYVCDTETTGTKSENLYHEIVEISVIRVSDRVQISRTIRADNPNHASLDALRITNKTVEDLKIGISKAQAVSDINNFFNLDGKTPAHRCLIGHNIVSFDLRFFHEMWQSQNSQFPVNLWLDTYKLMKKYAKDAGLDKKTKLSLDASCDLLGVKKIAKGMHSAKVDSRNNYYLYKGLLDFKVDYIPMIETHPHFIPGFNNFEDVESDDD